jgi:hypothetical protein
MVGRSPSQVAELVQRHGKGGISSLPTSKKGRGIPREIRGLSCAVHVSSRIQWLLQLQRHWANKNKQTPNGIYQIVASDEGPVLAECAEVLFIRILRQTIVSFAAGYANKSKRKDV